jgi:hypothetical protein
VGGKLRASMTVNQKPPPARVVWFFAEEDRSLAQELVRLSSVLVGQGLIENRDVPLGVSPGQEWLQEIFNRALDADVVLLLVSHELWAKRILLIADFILNATGAARKKK